jgi:hypothetical protein
MNKRTKEIAEQSYEQQPLMVVNPQTYEPEHKIGNGGVPMYHRVFNQEKFAELLVRECMAMCKTAVGNADYNTGRLHCLNNIKEHFGVEE